MKTLSVAIEVLLIGGLLVACGGSKSSSAGASGEGNQDVMFGSQGGTTGSGGQTSTASGGTAHSSGGSPSTSVGGTSSTSVGGTPSTSVGDAGDQDAAMASGGTANGGPGGTQPLGALCVNNSQCSQSQGASVCCVAAGCSAPCECTLQSDCPANTAYLQCATTADCAQYGGGKICCEVMTSQDTMRFCTKQSACTGTILR